MNKSKLMISAVLSIAFGNIKGCCPGLCGWSAAPEMDPEDPKIDEKKGEGNPFLNPEGACSPQHGSGEESPGPLPGAINKGLEEQLDLQELAQKPEVPLKLLKEEDGTKLECAEKVEEHHHLPQEPNGEESSAREGLSAQDQSESPEPTSAIASARPPSAMLTLQGVRFYRRDEGLPVQRDTTPEEEEGSGALPTVLQRDASEPSRPRVNEEATLETQVAAVDPNSPEEDAAVVIETEGPTGPEQEEPTQQSAEEQQAAADQESEVVAPEAEEASTDEQEATEREEDNLTVTPARSEAGEHEASSSSRPSSANPSPDRRATETSNMTKGQKKNARRRRNKEAKRAPSKGQGTWVPVQPAQ